MDIQKTDDFKFCLKEVLNEEMLKILDEKIINKNTMNYFGINFYQKKVSYLSNNRLSNVKMKRMDPFNNPYRLDITIGRFLVSHMGDILSKKDIENISNIFKSRVKLLSDIDYSLEITQGHDIIYWYQERNYKCGHGQLNNSCMKNVDRSRIRFYAELEDVCKLIILKTPDNKLLGRALLWKTNKGWYMDRVYTVYDEDKHLFIKYAEDNNYLSFENGDNYYKKMIVKINRKFRPKKENFPYLDTFQYYYYIKGILTNEYSGSMFYIELDHTY